jgi:hypothetical protein
VGELTAQTIVAEIGMEMARFPHRRAQHLIRRVRHLGYDVELRTAA